MKKHGGLVQRWLPLIGDLSALVVALLGVACVLVSALVFETSDGFYVTLFSLSFPLPDTGMLGDFGTYKAEWAILGWLCIACGALFVRAPRLRDRLHREIAFVGLALLFVAAMGFAGNVLL